MKHQLIHRSWTHLSLAALAAILALATPDAAWAFKPGYHEDITEEVLGNRGFDVDSADEVGDSNYYTDYAEASSDAAHADNNMLDAASARLRLKRTEIGDALNGCERRTALDSLGEALHTVQDIYSHSNSVDNDHAVGPGNLLGLGRGTASCSLPDFAPGGLVTGYFSLAGWFSPFEDQCRGLPANMCCHRDLNKDAPDELNGDFHGDALTAAGDGTSAYLDLLEQDIRTRFGESKAGQMIKLLERKQRTVYFVIDDTGSMSGDIAAVKSTVSDLLDEVIAGDEAPTLGLASFKDFVNDRGVSCDVEALRSQVNGLFASGGGDCPEASNSALLEALSHFPVLGLDMQLRGGRILLATDASAGDASLGPKVAVQSTIKGVSIDAILTGDCVAEEAAVLGGEEIGLSGSIDLTLPDRATEMTAPGGGEEDGQSGFVDLTVPARGAAVVALAGEVVDPLTSPSARTQLRALTEQTGGVLFNVSRFEVDSVIPTLLDLGRPNVAVIFSRRATLATGVPFVTSVPVDESLEESVTFMVTSSTAGALPSLILLRPDGSTVASGDPDVTIRNLSSVRTITIQAPTVGAWQATLSGVGTFNLRVFGPTDFQLNSVRLQKDAPDFLRPELELAPLTGQPFVGDSLVADFRYTGAPQAVDVAVRRPDGSLLAELSPVIRLNARRFRAALTIPGESFLVETTGVTAAGNPFVRQVSLPAVPQTVALEVEPPGLTAPPETPTHFTLRVRNSGTLDGTFRLFADAQLPWSLSGLANVDVPADGAVEVPITVVVPAGTPEGTTNVITLFAENVVTPQVRNSASFTVIAGSPNSPPDCSAAAARPHLLWPANHSLKSINISGITDPDGDAVGVTVTAITQDEPVGGRGSGDMAPDGIGVGTALVSVRAERQGGGDGRVYEIQFTADDGHGGVCSGAVSVGVPHDNKRGAVDSGQLYDSTAIR